MDSPINFLAALIWFLRKYKDGVYYTLPHAVELAQQPYDYRNNSMKLLDNESASAKIPLGRLASPDLYYILPVTISL